MKCQDCPDYKDDDCMRLTRDLEGECLLKNILSKLQDIEDGLDYFIESYEKEESDGDEWKK